MTLITTEENTTLANDKRRVSSNKLDIVILSVDSYDNLGIILSELKSPPGWNIEAHYFILNLHCLNAIDYLKIAWKMNLLSSLFLCYEPEQGITLYTYNPYTNRAPLPWQQVQNSKLQNDQRWTLYNRAYKPEEICENLIFDKMQFLDGYPIKALAHATGDSPSGESAHNDPHKYISSSDILKIIFPTLNSEPIISFEGPMYLDNMGHPLTGALADLSNDVYDIALNYQYLRKMNNYELFDHTYPFTNSSLIITTHRTELMTPLEKFHRLYSNWVIGLSCATALLTLLAIAIYEKRGFGIASFEILRLTTGNGLMYLSNNWVMRIYIYPVFILFLILGTMFNGKLSSFLTQANYHDNIETIEDLENSNHDIYAAQTIRNYLGNINRTIDFHSEDSGTCSNIIKKIRDAACIGRQTYDFALKHNLHVSKETVIDFYEVYLTRKYWPIKKKIDSILARLMEAGILPRSRYKRVQKWLRTLSKNEQTTEEYRSINKKDLSFAFKLLGIGLTLATICFVIEMVFLKKINIVQ